MSLYNSDCLQMVCGTCSVLKWDFVLLFLGNCFYVLSCLPVTAVFKAKVDMERKSFGKHIVYWQEVCGSIRFIASAGCQQK
jgi:hypothetical protein